MIMRTLGFVSGLGFLLCAAGCAAKADAGNAAAETRQQAEVRASGVRGSACALVTKPEMEALTGASFGSIEDHTDKGSSRTECAYVPADGGMAPRVMLEVTWNDDVASARAGMIGASLGGSIAQRTAGADTGFSVMRPGSVAGLGDDASVNANLLSVRKGSTLITIQAMLITDVMKMVMDTAAIRDQLEKEKAIARAVLAKV